MPPKDNLTSFFSEVHKKVAHGYHAFIFLVGMNWVLSCLYSSKNSFSKFSGTETLNWSLSGVFWILNFPDFYGFFRKMISNVRVRSFENPRLSLSPSRKNANSENWPKWVYIKFNHHIRSKYWFHSSKNLAKYAKWNQKQLQTTPNCLQSR